MTSGFRPLSSQRSSSAIWAGVRIFLASAFNCFVAPSTVSLYVPTRSSHCCTFGPDSFNTLTVPVGALSSPVAITATLVTGRGVNAVHFQPEGLKFARSASLAMSYANCSLLGRLLPKRIAYVGDGLSILSYLLSIDNLFAKQVTGRVDHFSNYAVAW